MPELKECEFSIICDVGNTLTGKNGSSYVYARQKGASDAEIRQMDVWMQNYVEIAKKINPLADENYPGWFRILFPYFFERQVDAWG